MEGLDLEEGSNWAVRQVVRLTEGGQHDDYKVVLYANAKEKKKIRKITTSLVLWRRVPALQVRLGFTGPPAAPV